MNDARHISCADIRRTVRDLFIEANFSLEHDVSEALRKARDVESSILGRYVLEQILSNATQARADRTPLCQDTGLALVFLELGQDIRIVEGDLYEAIQEGTRDAYSDAYLRKSVCDPLSRVNTTDNLPAFIHTDIVSGNHLKICVMPKGGGSENMSSAAMLVPAEGYAGVKQYVLERVTAAGSNPCPPIIVGVGIGGNLDIAALLAKKSLLRPVGCPNSRDERLRTLEKELLREINQSGTGPQGFGGLTTALAVHAEMAPCHIASLPVAVNIQCHVARHKEALL